MLIRPEVGRALLESARVYHEKNRWYARLFLAMPDHVHALLAFPPQENLSEVIRNWKSFTARKLGIEWQRNFFDHRLRSDEQWELKAEYIRQNPVRKGLISSAAQWPYLFES